MALLLRAEWIVKRFDIPGFSFSSNLISLPASVTALFIFLALTSAESKISITPEFEADDLLILAFGSCRSLIFAADLIMCASGIVKVCPYLELNL